MKRTLPLVFVALLLAGCSAQAPGDAYVSAVVREVPQILERGTEADLEALGVNVCEYIDSGWTPEDVIDDFVGGGISRGESKVAVDKALEILCP